MEKFYSNQAKFDEVRMCKDYTCEQLNDMFEELAHDSHEWYTNSENKQSLLFLVYPETLWYQGELDVGEQEPDSDHEGSDSDASDREDYKPASGAKE